MFHWYVELLLRFAQIILVLIFHKYKKRFKKASESYALLNLQITFTFNFSNSFDILKFPIFF